MNENPKITFDGFIARYCTAPDDKKQAALIAAQRALDGESNNSNNEPTFGLNELPPFFGLKHYTSLSRLKVQRVGISFGGRLRYRVSDVQKWLQSDECLAIRAELRRQRGQQKIGKDLQ